MLFAPFDIKFMSQKAIKGQIIADFLETRLYPDNEVLSDDLVMFVETKS